MQMETLIHEMIFKSKLSAMTGKQDKKAKKLAEQRERQAEAKERRERQRAKAFKAPKEGGKASGGKDKDGGQGCEFNVVVW